IMLVGSVPLKPASAVYEAVCDHGLAPLMHRVPDGEQAGWDSAFFALATLPVFEPSRKKRMTLRPSTFFEHLEVPYVKLRPGKPADDIDLSLGIAANAKKSYAEFARFKAEGRFGTATRFCVTLPGPATFFGPVEISARELFPAAERIFRAEMGEILAAIP